MTPFSSTYSIVTVCSPGSKPSGGVQSNSPFASIADSMVCSCSELTVIFIWVPGGPCSLISGDEVATKPVLISSVSSFTE